MNVNAEKLDAELRAAGVPIDGVGFAADGSVRIDFQATATVRWPLVASAADCSRAASSSRTLENVRTTRSNRPTM